MKKPELLAPAGNHESLIAAVQNGADAVYLGGKHYGARAFAGNFDDEEMIEAIGYCHQYGVKVYVTLNTLIYSEEMEGVVEYAEFLYRHGVDAVLVQDLGLAEILHQHLPELSIHASTQMFVHDEGGIELAKSLGVERIVLARECSLSEVQKLQNRGVELEIFVNGSLCVSCSGQCYFSLDQGNRSGNRGDCAQPCRLQYSLKENESYVPISGDFLLSPKDLYTINRVRELVKCGIDSFKIEGRMKRSEYVGFIVSEYRRAIDAAMDDSPFTARTDELERLFHRQHTEGHLFGNRGPDLMNPQNPNHSGVLLGYTTVSHSKHLSIKLTRDLHQNDGLRVDCKDPYGFIANYIEVDGLLTSQAKSGSTVVIPNQPAVKEGTPVLLTTDHLLNQEIRDSYLKSPRHEKVHLIVDGHIGSPLTFTLSYKGTTCTVSHGDPLTEATNRPINKEDLDDLLSRTQDTPYVFDPIEYHLDKKVFIPKSIVNQLRRKSLDELSSLLIGVSDKPIETYQKKNPSIQPTNYTLITLSTEEQFQILSSTPYLLFTEDKALYEKHKDRLFLSLPRYSLGESYDSMEYGYVNELSSLDASIQNKFGGQYLNVTNPYSLNVLYQHGLTSIDLSRELNDSQIQDLLSSYEDLYQSKPNVTYFIYGRRDLMLSRFCLPNTYCTDTHKPHCGLCKKNSYTLCSEKNEYPLAFDENCFMHILESKPFNRIEDYSLLSSYGITNFHLHFTTENKDEVKKIIDAYSNHSR